jgi:hypothetical protein
MIRRSVRLAVVSLTATLVSLLAPGRLFTPQQQLKGARHCEPGGANGVLAAQPEGRILGP